MRQAWGRWDVRSFESAGDTLPDYTAEPPSELDVPGMDDGRVRATPTRCHR